MLSQLGIAPSIQKELDKPKGYTVSHTEFGMTNYSKGVINICPFRIVLLNQSDLFLPSVLLDLLLPIYRRVHIGIVFEIDKLVDFIVRCEGTGVE